MGTRRFGFSRKNFYLLFINWILLFAAHLDFNEFIVRVGRLEEYTGNCKSSMYNVYQANQSDFVINILAVLCGLSKTCTVFLQNKTRIINLNFPILWIFL